MPLKALFGPVYRFCPIILNSQNQPKCEIVPCIGNYWKDHRRYPTRTASFRGVIKASRSLSFWVKRFCLLGGIVGGVSLSVPALCPKKRDLGNILTDLLYTVPNGVVTGSLCGFVLAIIWWKYDKKLDT
jgi:hypothetical protein